MAPLEEYRRKRVFGETSEPEGKPARAGGNHFVVQEHHATRLHYDFRLEVDGVLKSWAVPKGPSLNPADKRLAMQTEDHPLEYRTFEGIIPKGHYGAGEVYLWDEGTFDVEGSLPAGEQIERGEIKFILYGRRLNGGFVLVKLRGDRRKNEWLLIKHRDEAADPEWKLPSAAEAALAASDGRKKGRKAASAKRIWNPDMPAGAREAEMPDARKIEAALATLAENPPDGDEWLFEIKWDGIRAIAELKEGKVRLWSRNHREITSEFPELAEIAQSVKSQNALLDGEIVTLDEEGRSNFERLQARMGVRRPAPELQEQVPVVYYIFDVLYADGYDLRSVPLLARKEFLRSILQNGSRVLYSHHQIGEGKELFSLARERHLEGIVGKKKDASYPSGRTTSWLKFKLEHDVDGVVGGWTEPRGSREYFGALLLGLYDRGKLHFIGGIGSGFTTEFRKQLWPHLQKLKTSACPFRERPSTREKATWVTPSLVVRVRFGGWTEGTHLRQPVFLGLQEDRDPRECTLEKETKRPVKPETESAENTGAQKKAAAHQSAAANPGAAKEIAAGELEQEFARGKGDEIFTIIEGKRLHFTNLNKTYFPESGIRKRDLLAYYYQISPLLLPFLKDRPLVLRRYPNGIEGESFFQKDAEKTAPDWARTVPILATDTGKPTHYFVANDFATLLYLTNLGCIDHNPWSSRAQDIEHPDYIFFDLDPAPETPWSVVMGAARLLMEILKKLKLDAFPKTSGATGFHIFLPVNPVYTYEQARTFVQVVASVLDARHPNLFTFERSLRKRPNRRIYLDAHQNSQGQSLATVYTVRAFPHAPVSTPVKYAEIRPGLQPERWNLRTMPQRLRKTGDLWAKFWQKKQGLEQAVELLEKLR